MLVRETFGDRVEVEVELTSGSESLLSWLDFTGKERAGVSRESRRGKSDLPTES